MESKLVLHTKTRHINVYAHSENVTHLTKEKMGTLNLQGGTTAYVKQFIDDHNQDESAHPYIQENLSALEGTVTEHIEDTNNPHTVTKEQVGLGNVDNTSDADKPISAATQTALDGKQATISDLETIRSGAALGATSVQPGDLATVATTGDYNDLTNKPTIPSQASDVHALPDTTKYGASLDLDINSSTYVVTAQLKDQDGNTLGTAQTIDLPLESVVVSGSYDSVNKKVVLTLQNGSTVEFSVADLVAGLQSEITSSNKLSADLVDDTSTTHKFVTASDKSTWNGKQDAINDLATIRSGAAAGATALQPSVAASTYATKAEIADQYTKSNLLPKVPVAFEKAQVSDFYTVTGSPTITDGVASGFSNSNYLQISQTYNATNDKNVEIYVRAKTPTTISSSFNPIFGADNIGYWGISSYTNALFTIRMGYSNGTTLTFGDMYISGGVQADTWYRFKIKGSNGIWRAEIYNDSGTLLNSSDRDWTSNTLNANYTIKLKCTDNTNTYSGSIDLNETYIKVNGKYFVPPLSSTIVSVSSMTGATSSAAGTSGLVPAPAAGDEAKFLRGDGRWVGSTSSVVWGAISGTLSDQTDLQTAINSVKRNIGEIVPSMLPLTDAGLHLLDGALISGTGIYSAFVTYIVGLVSSYPNLFVTENAWQTSVTNYGVCGKFVYDSTNNTVRLPKITGILEGTIDATALGDLVEAGLPNITGTSNFAATSSAFTGEGAFTKTVYGTSVTGTSVGNHYKPYFDASDSSPIFGNSNTVQPQTIKGFYYIVVSNSTKTEIEVDIDEIATDLNGKADVDLTNCTKPHIVETYVNGTSWYRVYSDGWCEQGGRFKSNDGSSTTVSFLQEFLDTNYTLVGLQYGNLGNDPYVNGWKVITLNTSSAVIKNNTNGTNSFMWRACGYIS